MECSHSFYLQSFTGIIHQGGHHFHWFIHPSQHHVPLWASPIAFNFLPRCLENTKYHYPVYNAQKNISGHGQLCHYTWSFWTKPSSAIDFNLSSNCCKSICFILWDLFTNVSHNTYWPECPQEPKSNLLFQISLLPHWFIIIKTFCRLPQIV